MASSDISRLQVYRISKTTRLGQAEPPISFLYAVSLLPIELRTNAELFFRGFSRPFGINFISRHCEKSRNGFRWRPAIVCRARGAQLRAEQRKKVPVPGFGPNNMLMLNADLV